MGHSLHWVSDSAQRKAKGSSPYQAARSSVLIRSGKKRISVRRKRIKPVASARRSWPRSKYRNGRHWSVRPVKRSDTRRLRGKPAKRKNANGIVNVRRSVSANVTDGQRKTVGSGNTRRCSMTSTVVSKGSAHKTHCCTSRS